MEPEGTPRKFSDEEKTVLSLLMYFCSAIGSGNDADDHGYRDEAERLREESCDSLRNLAEQHPFLEELFPGLHRELNTGHILGFGWSRIYREAEALLAEDGR